MVYGPGAPGDSLLQCLQDHVEDRGQEQAEEGNAEHPAEDCDTHGAAHLGTRALGKDQREDAHDEGEGGHQDWPKTKPRSLDRGVQGFPAAGFQLSGELDDQDRVLAG